jgi:hypothetical protein
VNRRGRIAFTLSLAFFGYVGAAIFYSYLIGLDWQTPFACLYVRTFSALAIPYINL